MRKGFQTSYHGPCGSIAGKLEKTPEGDIIISANFQSNYGDKNEIEKKLMKLNLLEKKLSPLKKKQVEAHLKIQKIILQQN